jgi:hypothetical protein
MQSSAAASVRTTAQGVGKVHVDHLEVAVENCAMEAGPRRVPLTLHGPRTHQYTALNVINITMAMAVRAHDVHKVVDELVVVHFVDEGVDVVGRAAARAGP